MPGLTLCGDLGEWVGDEDLLNCCPEDTNEPPNDDFDTRLRVMAEGAWVNPQVGFCTEEDRINFLPGVNADAGTEEGEVVVQVSTRHTLSLPVDARPDYTRWMEVDFATDLQLRVGSRERVPIGRYRRYVRK